MKNKTYAMMFSAVVGTAFVAVAAAPSAIYTPEKTVSWFSVDTSELSALSNPPWTLPSTGTATLSSGIITLQNADLLVYAPSTMSSDKIVRTVINVEGVVSDDEPTISDFSDAQATIFAYCDANEAITWRTIVGDAFVTLSGHTPAESTAYEVMVEFNYNTQMVRYSVREAGASEFTVLTYNSYEWIANHVASSSALSTVNFSGTGSIGDFSADYVRQAVATVDGEAYDVLQDAVDAAATSGKELVLTANCSTGAAIASGLTVKISGNYTISGNITGAGTIVIEGDGTNETTLPAIGGLNKNTWTGTVVFKNCICTAASLNLNSYGNSVSTISTDGLTAKLEDGTQYKMTVNVADGGFTMVGEIPDSYIYFSGVISGSGSVAVNITSDTETSVSDNKNSVTLTFAQGSTFNGNLTVGGDYAVLMLGTLKESDLPDDIARGQFFVSSHQTSIIRAGNTWTAAGGVRIEGTVTNLGTIDSTVTGSGTVIYDCSGLSTMGAIFSGVTDVAGWKGTVLVKNVDSEFDIGTAQWGNSASTVMLDAYVNTLNSATLANVGVLDITNSQIMVTSNITFNNQLNLRTGATLNCENSAVFTVAGDLHFVSRVVANAGNLALAAGSTVYFDSNTAAPFVINTPATLTLPATGKVNLDISNLEFVSSETDFCLMGGAAFEYGVGSKFTVVDTQSRGRLPKVMSSNEYGCNCLFVGNAEAKIGSTEYGSLSQALEAATDGQTVTLLKSLKLGSAYLTPDMQANCKLDTGDYLLQCSLAPKNSKTITIEKGNFDLRSQTSASLILMGGRYVSNIAHGEATVPSGYYFVQMLLPETVSDVTCYYEIVKTGTEPSSSDVAVEVTNGPTISADLADLKDFIGYNGDEPATAAAEAETFLSTEQNNGLLGWQSYVLDLEPNTVNDKPVVKTVQNTKSGKISFCMGHGASAETLTSKTDSGVVVTYAVDTYDSPNATTPSAEGTLVPASQTVELDAPSSGVKYYKLRIHYEQ